MSPLAVFGITNDGLNLAVNLVLLFLFVLYFALIWWTYADARRRIEDPMIVTCATAASVFPFVGTVVYLIVRPPEYLEDVRERELEIAAAEARLAGVEQHVCPYCSNEVEKSFLVCPNCRQRLKEPCTTCGRPLDPRWKVCPYCEAEVGSTNPRPARQRRPRRERPPAGAPAAAATAADAASGQPAPQRTAAAAAPQTEVRESRQGPPPTEQRAARPAGRTERPAAGAPRDRPTGERTR
jgi:Double zinc ribbon